MLTLTNAKIDSTLARLGLHRRQNGELALLGIRGAVPVDETTIRTGAGNAPNAYNDCLCLYGPVLHAFKGSVDPGSTYTADPANPDGCAHLLNGSFVYQWGMHKGHPALVEAEPVRIWRDRNRDGVFEPGEKVETGIYGIHIHAGGTSAEVDDWSAGCQVVWGGWGGAQWLAFKTAIQASGQRTFAYTLIDASDLD